MHHPSLSHIIKSLAILLFIFAVTNCQSSVDPLSKDINNIFELSANIEQTKTIVDNNVTSWCDGDRLMVWYGPHNSSDRQISNFVLDRSVSGNFISSDIDKNTLGKCNDWAALYSDAKVYDLSESVSFSIGRDKQSQNGSSMSHCSGLMCPLYGFSEGVLNTETPQLYMTHLSSILKIDICNSSTENLNVNNVTVRTPGKPLVGYYKNISCNNRFTIEPVMGQTSDFVSIAVNNLTIEKGKTSSVYLVCAPFQLEKNQILEITVNDLKKSVRMSQFVTVSPGKIKTIPFTYGVGNNTNRFKVVAYVPGQGDWPYDAAMKKKLRWEQFTHVNLHFIIANEDGTINTEEVATNIGWIANEAKKHGVKVLASVRSGANNSFASAISTPERRTRLCKALWAFVDTYGIDGIDIDYENWINFDELNLFAEELGKLKGNHLLTSAVNPQEIAKRIYKIGWHKSFDFINIMAYDFGEWKDGVKQPGQHSSYEDAEKSVRMWINELNTPAEKLVLGVPFYGYSHDETLKELFTWKNEISYENLVKYDPKAADVDQYGPSTFYNGRPTIMKKCQMVVDNQLGGIMIWNIKYDTLNDEYSLLNVISNSLNFNIGPAINSWKVDNKPIVGF